MTDRQQKLMQVMDKVNRRYGNGTIHTGAENSAAWKPQQTNLSPHYTTDLGRDYGGSGELTIVFGV
jgi:hypothetical protein